MKSRIFWLAIFITAAVLMFSATALGWSPYGYGPPWAGPGPAGWQSPQPVPNLQVQRGSDQDNYYVTIRVSGMAPEAVTVTVERGRWLAIRTEESRESSYEDTAADQSAYYRSFSYSSGTNTRRMRLPQDADVASLQREDGEGQIRIVIPRRR